MAETMSRANASRMTRLRYQADAMAKSKSWRKHQFFTAEQVLWIIDKYEAQLAYADRRHRGFKEIPGFPGYWVNRNGEVRSQCSSNGQIAESRWHKLAQHPNKKGYLRVDLQLGRRAVKRRVHRLVLLTFVGPCPAGMEACHENGNPADNRLLNLRWDTQESNMADRLRHEAETLGITVDELKARKAKKARKAGEPRKARVPPKRGVPLTEDDVREIRRLWKEGWSFCKLGKKFVVNSGTIGHICRGRSWKHVK